MTDAPLASDAPPAGDAPPAANARAPTAVEDSAPTPAGGPVQETTFHSVLVTEVLRHVR